MLQECLTLLRPAGAGTQEKIFVDATFGAGGHARALLDSVPNCKLLAIDADPAAVDRAKAMSRAYHGRLVATHANFGELDAALDRAGFTKVDAILYDLGLSSLQLADHARGFSFAGDEPLDMRLDPASDSPSASDLLNTLPQAELETILREHGDERRARSIARAILRRRPRVRRWRTGDLVAAVLSGLPAKRSRKRIHPATRAFQALRIAVNQDLPNLERSLETAVRRLRPAGRVVVISFQSVEDRIVKQRFKAFAAAHLARILTRKPMRPTATEVRSNPRSRSAKLRAIERPSSESQEGRSS